MSKETKVVILGSGSPIPRPDRMGPGLAIVSGGKAYLVDCGIGIVRQTQGAFKKGVEELEIKEIDKCFITHLHSDHTMGLPDLMYTPWIEGREKPLELIGPKGTQDMVDNINKAYKIDLDGRINGMEPTNQTGYKVNVKEIENTGVIYEDEVLKVEVFYVNHMPFDAFGYKFITKDKTIVVSGDTAPIPDIIEAGKDCDILVHEVFSSSGIKNSTMEWAIYHGSVHTSSIDLGRVAKKINPKKLVLYHQLFMPGENKDGSFSTIEDREKQMIEEIRENFDGEIISSKDLDIIY